MSVASRHWVSARAQPWPGSGAASQNCFAPSALPSVRVVMEPQATQHTEFAVMSKVAVHTLADHLCAGGPDAVERCVRFVCAETRGHWHGRGRAMMCRRLKHVALSQDQQRRLLSAILQRLTSGRFAEQFRDQLRLALHLNQEATYTLARGALQSEKEYVRRLAHWVLSRAHPTVDVRPATKADVP